MWNNKWGMNWGAGTDVIPNRSKQLKSVPNVSTTQKMKANVSEAKFPSRGE